MLCSSSNAKVHIWRNNKPTDPSHRQVTDDTADDVLREIGPGLLDVIGTIAWATSWAQDHYRALRQAGRRLVQSPATRYRREVPECGVQGHGHPQLLARCIYPPG